MSLDTTSSYLGFTLATPLVVGSCPLTLQPDAAKRMVEAGAGALVLPSLFEEQIEFEWFDGGSQTPIAPDQFPVSLTFNKEMTAYNGGQFEYLRSIEKIRGATSVPIIANLNGVGDGQWLSFAKDIEDAGANAIELTLYRLAMDRDEFAEDIEHEYLTGVSHLCREVSIPVTVKLLPFFTSLPNFVGRVAGAGAAGTTLFGRYPPCESLPGESKPGSAHCRINWELTEPGDVSLPQQWLPILRQACPKLSYAASGGATSGENVLRLMRSGADAVMITSPLYRDGPESLQKILSQMCDWATENGHESFHEIVGQSCMRHPNFPQAYERAAATNQITAVDQDD